MQGLFLEAAAAWESLYNFDGRHAGGARAAGVSQPPIYPLDIHCKLFFSYQFYVFEIEMMPLCYKLSRVRHT